VKKGAIEVAIEAKIIQFPKKSNGKTRKTGLNQNKDGSVRKINGKVYVDFVYLGERIRESSELPWNLKNAKIVRGQLDKIIGAIKSGTFKFAEVFPKSSKKDFFTKKEIALSGIISSDEIRFKDYVWDWYNLLKESERVEERTLAGYKSYIKLYLIPFFGEKAFSELDKSLFDEFVSWAKKQRYRKKKISSKTVNKILVPMKMICKDAAIKYKWGNTYNPFFGFKRLSENDPYEKINPFSLDEQKKLITKLPDFWKPYFRFAFAAGPRIGEQIAIKSGDIDWSRKVLRITRAITTDEDRRPKVGLTKNKYSRRTIKLISPMMDALKAQKRIYDQFMGEFFFCSPTGARVEPSNLRYRVWRPALKMADIAYRDMKQTRHSFATIALSLGENPLWIAKVMGHRNSEMIIKVYGKYIEDVKGTADGSIFGKAFQTTIDEDGER
jgi:integrase